MKVTVLIYQTINNCLNPNLFVLVDLQVGLIYVFNLIVGTGALTMPLAFARAGWAMGGALITILAFAR